MFRKISSAFRTVANTVTQPKVLVRALLLGAVISASLLTGCVERSNLGFGGESNSVSFAQPKSTGSEIQQREARAQAYWQGREDALEEEAMMQGGGVFRTNVYGKGRRQVRLGDRNLEDANNIRRDMGYGGVGNQKINLSGKRRMTLPDGSTLESNPYLNGGQGGYDWYPKPSK